MALTGSFSAKLDRDCKPLVNMTNTELFIMYSYRPAAEYDWGPWEGLPDGISRTKLASGAC